MRKAFQIFLFLAVCVIGFFEPDPRPGEQRAIVPIVAAAAISAVGAVGGALISKKSAKDQQSRAVRAEKALIKAQTQQAKELAMLNMTPSASMTGSTLQVQESQQQQQNKMLLYLVGGVLLAKVLKVF